MTAVHVRECGRCARVRVSPVWKNKKKDKEVYMLNPRGQGGFKGATACVEWLKPMKDAVLAVSRCVEVKKGVKTREWSEDFNF